MQPVTIPQPDIQRAVRGFRAGVHVALGMPASEEDTGSTEAVLGQAIVRAAYDHGWRQASLVIEGEALVDVLADAFTQGFALAQRGEEPDYAAMADEWAQAACGAGHGYWQGYQAGIARQRARAVGRA